MHLIFFLIIEIMLYYFLSKHSDFKFIAINKHVMFLCLKEIFKKLADKQYMHLKEHEVCLLKSTTCNIHANIQMILRWNFHLCDYFCQFKSLTCSSKHLLVAAPYHVLLKMWWEPREYFNPIMYTTAHFKLL